MTIATHQNMRDPNFTMFYDEKHLKRNSAPRFAKNIIRAMLSAYNIQNKSELYTEKSTGRTIPHNNDPSRQRAQPLMQKNLMTLAGYGQTRRWSPLHQTNTNSNNNNNNNNNYNKKALEKSRDYIATSCFVKDVQYKTICFWDEDFEI